MRKRSSYVLFLLLLLVAPSVSHATPTYTYVFDQANYSVSPGGTVLVSVSLRETLELGDTSLLDTEGLFGTGVRVYFDVPVVPSDPAEVLALGDITINPAFDGLSAPDLVAGSSAGFTAAIDLLSPPVFGTGGPTDFDIPLGTFSFTAGLIPGEITNITATDFGPSDDNVTNDTLTVLDSLIADDSATITVLAEAVPEPGTFVLAGLGLAGLALFAWRIGRHS